MKTKNGMIAFLSLFFLIAGGVGFSQFGFRHTSEEIRDLIRVDKLDVHLIPILKEFDVDCWITLTRDPCDDMTNVIWERNIQLDPIVEFIGGEGAKVPAAFIFTVSGERIAIVGSGDAPEVESTGIYKTVHTYTYNRMKGHDEFVFRLEETIRRLNPRNIGLNYSEEEGVADGLTYGMKRMFDRAVGAELASRVKSAEKVIISLWNRKVPAEIYLIEKSSRKSAAITDDVLGAVVPGRTTAREIFDAIRSRMEKEGMSPGWQEWWCPTVTVGAFSLGAPPSDKVVERGDLIVINSGFLIEGHMSDINRIAYVLKEGEVGAPPDIQKMFDTGLGATRAAVAKIKPGATGFDVDRAARDVVTGAGYREYGHATGHTTGLWVHGLGIILGPEWRAYGQKVHMKMHKDDIYAVEPSISVQSEAHGGRLRIHFQEMVIVTEESSRYLIEPVTELMLIK